MILSVRLDNIEEEQLKTITECYNEISHTKLNKSDIIRVMISDYYSQYKILRKCTKKDSG